MKQNKSLSATKMAQPKACLNEKYTSGSSLSTVKEVLKIQYVSLNLESPVNSELVDSVDLNDINI